MKDILMNIERTDLRRNKIKKRCIKAEISFRCTFFSFCLF